MSVTINMIGNSEKDNNQQREIKLTIQIVINQNLKKSFTLQMINKLVYYLL